MFHKVYFIFFIVTFFGYSQEIKDSTLVEIDTAKIIATENTLFFDKHLIPFYQKLGQLQKTKKGKINIVHIGDSHILADLLTGASRSLWQNKYGDGGRGLVFPHRLAKSNGASDYKFSSNIPWESSRVVSQNPTGYIGVSGFCIFSSKKDFVIEWQSKYHSFNTLKIITPNNQSLFEIATSKETISLENEVPKKIIHKIKNGETLSEIAEKYNVTIASLKKNNNLKNNNIRAGKTLKIPSIERETKRIPKTVFTPIALEKIDNYHSFTSDESLSKIYILPKEDIEDATLNGIVLENNQPGILYHTIGVNGAKAIDYNRFYGFFEQLSVLNPDLVIISLGTNESFDKMNVVDFSNNLKEMISAVKTKCSNTSILLTTPPPSLFNRRNLNVYVKDYTEALLKEGNNWSCAVWDLFGVSGGLNSVPKNYSKGWIAPDKVHYTKTGYEWQGKKLTEAIFASYELFTLKITE